MKIYPFEVPEGFHPKIWTILGFGLPPEQANMIVRHLFDNLGVRLDESRSEVTYSWAVGVAGDWPDCEIVDVGDGVNFRASDRGAVRVTGGALPPGVRLEKHTGRLIGTFTHPGRYSVTLTIGPTVKYDPLGSPGGPGDPGAWIPIDHPRQPAITALSDFPATVDDLPDRDKDQLLAELLAWRDGEIVKEADRGN